MVLHSVRMYVHLCVYYEPTVHATRDAAHASSGMIVVVVVVVVFPSRRTCSTWTTALKSAPSNVRRRSVGDRGDGVSIAI